MSKLVRKTLADSPMTPARKRKLAQLAERPDAEIDFSDIPPLKESFWKNAVRNPFYRPVKQQLTVRLDADVVAWLRQQGKGYQTRLNTSAPGSDAGRHQEKRLKIDRARAMNGWPLSAESKPLDDPGWAPPKRK